MKQKLEESEKEEQENTPTFIHLKNALYFNTNGEPISTKGNTWWRGRISSLDGFSLDFLV